MSDYNINLHETIYSLSDALDLVGVVQVHHGKRVGYMAAECGKILGLDDNTLDDLFQAAILHDCGVSNTAVHQRLAQFDWEEKAHGHSEIGALILKNTPPLAHLSEVVLHHHTHWPKFEHLDVSDDVALLANCIFMVDRVDVLSLKSQVNDANILLGIDDIRQKIDSQRDTWFKPELVDAFMEVSDSESFWLSLEREHVSGYVSEWISHESTKESYLSIEARILAVSDVFQALAQNRPYRKELSPEVILSIIRQEANEGKLDNSVVDMIEKHLIPCWNVALLQSEGGLQHG